MTDAFNLHDAVLTPAVDWPATAEITSLSLTPQGLAIDFTKKAEWPNVTPAGWQGPIEFTVWLGRKLNGTWHLAAALNCWRGETEPLGGPVTDPTHYPKNLWYLDNDLKGVAADGDLAVMVTSGAMRGVEAPGPAERSNVVVVPFPPATGRTYTFTPATPVAPPVTPPAPPVVVPPVVPPPVVPTVDWAARFDAIDAKLATLASKDDIVSLRQQTVDAIKQASSLLSFFRR